MDPDLDVDRPDDDLTIRGDVGSSSVPELMRSLLGSGETGVLTFRNGDVTKQIHIQNGRVTYATSSNPDERLGENLLLRGRITARQYVEASKMIRPGRRLGTILVELAALESEELISAVEQHVRDLLIELLNWTHGTYELVIKEINAGDVITLNLSTENLILAGMRQNRSWSQVSRGIGSIESVLFPTGNTEILYKLELTEEEQEILAQVNGRSTVEQICQVSYLTNFETCRILWALQVLGIVRREQKGEAAVVGEGVKEKERELDLEGIVEKFNQMFARIYAFLKGRIGDQVDPFMDGALDEVSRQYGALFGGVDLKHYGRADFEQMLANVADLPPDQRKSLMVAGLNELVFVIQLSVRTQRGAQEEAVVSGIIKDGFKRLGAA
jgi:hypothetical protein